MVASPSSTAHQHAGGVAGGQAHGGAPALAALGRHIAQAVWGAVKSSRYRKNAPVWAAAAMAVMHPRLFACAQAGVGLITCLLTISRPPITYSHYTLSSNHMRGLVLSRAYNLSSTNHVLPHTLPSNHGASM
jgi:hypothetical protein